MATVIGHLEGILESEPWPVSAAVRSVYFDTQVFDAIGKMISVDEWKKIVEAVADGRLRYCVSINTLYELFNGLASGSPAHFEANKDRILAALRMPRAELLPFTREFLRRTLRLPTRPDLGHYMVKWLKPVVHRAKSPEDLVSASQDVQAQIDYGKSVWVKELTRAANEGLPIPSRTGHAKYIALENGIPVSPGILDEIAERLDAAYCHMVHIAKAVKNTRSRYRHEEKTSDWLDNQQLFYLSDPSFHFVTLEHKLIKKISGSKQANRVLRFPDFLAAL